MMKFKLFENGELIGTFNKLFYATYLMKQLIKYDEEENKYYGFEESEYYIMEDDKIIINMENIWD